MAALTEVDLPNADSPLRRLINLLDLEQFDVDTFRGHGSHVEALRLFGGHVAAQAAVAAGRTVEADRTLTTTQSTFLRAGDPFTPLEFHVERLGDGRSFSFRRVIVRQGQRPIFTSLATFHTGGTGPSHDEPANPTDPSNYPPFAPYYGQILTKAFDLRLLTDPATPNEQWLALRTIAPLGDAPLLHAAVLHYASDLYILATPLAIHGVTPDTHGYELASIDHAVWIHRPPRMDEWLVYRTVSPLASSSRTLIQGEMRRTDGLRIATVTQIGMLRD